MDLRELQGIVREEITRGNGRADDLSNEYKTASDYFYCKPNGTEVCGRSQVVDSALADSIEAVMAQVMPIFANDNIVSFDSVSPMDEVQARVESKACTDVVMNRSNGYKLFQQSIHNSLLYRNGINKITAVDELSYDIQEYEGLLPDQYTMLLQPQGPGEEVNVTAEEIIQTEQGPLINATISRKITTPKVCVESIEPKNFVFSADHDDIDLQDCSFTADVSFPRRYELIEAGYPPELVDTLTKSGGETEYSGNTTTEDMYSSSRGTDPIEIWHCTVRVDFDEDGYAELRNVVAAAPDYKILSNEPADCVPYAAGSPFPIAGKFTGQSFFDKLKDLQDSKTATERQYWDNLNANNNRRMAVDIKGIAEPDSLLDSKPAGIVKCKRPPGDVIMPIPVDDIGPSCIQALDYLDRQRSEKVGASLDMQSQQMQVSNETAHGAERLVSAKEEMSAYILSNLFNTLVKYTYLIVHKKLKTINTLLMFKDQGQWVQTATQGWLDRDQVSIDVGLSKGLKMARFAELQQIYEIQVGLNEQGKGGLLVDDTKIFNTLSDMVTVAGIGHADTYWVNPQSEQAQQTMQSNQQAQEEAAAKEEENRVTQLKLQTALAEAETTKAQNGYLKVEIDKLKAILESVKSGKELEFDYEEMYQDHATKLAIADKDAKVQMANKDKLDG